KGGNLRAPRPSSPNSKRGKCGFRARDSPPADRFRGRDWVEDFVETCAAFPRGAHDDDVNALTQVLVRWNCPLGGGEGFLHWIKEENARLRGKPPPRPPQLAAAAAYVVSDVSRAADVGRTLAGWISAPSLSTLSDRPRGAQAWSLGSRNQPSAASGPYYGVSE